MDITQKALLERIFGRANQRPAPLPRSTVTHDSVDEMVFGNHADDSPRFRRSLIEQKPHIPPDVKDPDPIDFTSATPDEIKAWQKEAREAKEAREKAPEYDAWEDLTRDTFYSYHHPREPTVIPPDQVDPGIAHHSKIASKLMAEDDHARARNITRDSPTPAAIAAMAATKALRELLEDELQEQARQSEEYEQAVDEAQGAMQELDDLREQARDLAQQGQPIPQQLVDAVKQAVQVKRGAQGKAVGIAQNVPKPFSQAAHEAIEAAAAAGLQAAENAANIPSFDQGFGEGEPRYESPEQALTIADMWANNEVLRAVAELYGRIDPDMRFRRARRVVGGQDEIVDIKFGDDLRRLVSTELAYFADDDMEDDFYMRFLAGEVLVFDTVGEEHAGRGPIVMPVDESGSMSGERNVWAKAIALCLLNIARREKRDFAYIGFSGGNQVYSFEFPAKSELDPQQIVDMASHFFGGGTTPVLGLAEAERVMDHAEFRKADVVMVTDGEASFGPEDKRIRDKLAEKGVRFMGIGIGGSFRYLRDLTEDVIDIHDFDLENPSEATAHLATHVT